MTKEGHDSKPIPSPQTSSNLPDTKTESNNIEKTERTVEEILKILENNRKEELGSEDVNKLIDAGEVDVVVENIDKFNDVDHTEIAEKIIEREGNRPRREERRPRRKLSKHYPSLEKFKNLRASLAIKLIEEGEAGYVAKNISKFISSDHIEIANQLIDKGYVSEIAEYSNNFQGVDHKGIVDGILKSEEPYVLLEFVNNFPELDPVDIANRLIDLGYATSVAGSQSLQNFKGLDYVHLADRLLLDEDTQSIAENINKFGDLNAEIAERIIEAGYGDSVLENLDKFKDLGSETVEFLKKCNEFPDSARVYPLRNEFSLKEIIANYDYYRVKSWEEGNALPEQDKTSFLQLREFIDEETLGKLWQKNSKGELHIIGPQIIKMFKLTGLQSDTFRGQFLERIITDGASYNNPDAQGWEGLNENLNMTSLRHFNYIVENLDDEYGYILDEASYFEQTKALAGQLKQEGPFKSWEILKKYYELSELLKQREVLEKLENLKKEGKEKQYKFFSDLAFHPSSKISMQAVFQFMEDPARFLDVGDDHSGETHERKKPSNYTRFNYLDISAEDLRDALIEGTLDKLQYFKPFEAQYSIPNSEYLSEVLKMMLNEALGSFKKNIKGNAKNPGKLFQMTQQVLKKYGKEYKDLARDLPFMTNEIKNDLEQVLFNNDFGIKDTRKFNDYLVKIHPKSSPEGHLAGNDTACCMPFGSGKNNVYMYNLGCSVLTVQRKVGDKYRTIAQSVLTPDVDIRHSISDLVNQVQNETLLSNVIDEDLTQKKKIVITADNIEVAPNADKYKSVIEKIYSDFISRYAHEIDSNEIDKDRMLIGKGYSDLEFSRSKSINNTFIPITPVAYSDNYGGEVYELPLVEKSEIIPLPNYGFLQKVEKEVVDLDLPAGVSYLTAHDTLRVSYMEGKVYAENESLVQYIHRMGNELTAKDINNNFKGRHNLSLKVEDEKGAMLGYMIAYEGAEKNNDEDDNQKVIYISDLAADTSRSKLAGGRLIKAFKTLIKREYLDKNNFPPIIMQARESTSYAIVLNQLTNELRKNPDTEYGYKFEIEDNGSYESGDDTMHQIKLWPVKI